MATTNLIIQTLGSIQIQSGNGTPNHTSAKGSRYINLDTDKQYKNTDGGTSWQETDQLTNAEVKTAYEANADTNAFTDSDEAKLDSLSGNGAGDTWESGLSITAATPTTNQTVDYASGTYHINTVSKTIATGGNYDLDTGGANHFAALAASERMVVGIYVDGDEIIESVAGTAVPDTQTPSTPTMPANAVCLAFVEISKKANGSANKIENVHITDCRQTAAFNTDEMVRVSGADSTPSNLTDAISNNGNIKHTIENAGADESIKLDISGADIKTAYEGEANTNAFTDADESKLDAIEAGATGDQSDAEIKTAYENNADTNAYTDSEKTKLAGLESSKFLGEYASLGALQTAHPSPAVGSYANVDAGVASDVERYIWDNDDSAYVLQLGTSTSLTDAQIKTQYENNADTNAFTDADETKLDGIESGATADQTGAQIKTAYEAEADTNAFTDADESKLDAIEASATADQTDAEIRAAVEAATDSNVFTDADHSKLDGIESGATGDQTGSEIKIAYEAEANTNAYTDAEQTKLSNITISQAVDLDTVESDIVALNPISSSLQTTNATPTEVDKIDTLTDNSLHIIRVLVVAKDTLNADYGAWEYTLGVSKFGGVVSIKVTQTDLFYNNNLGGVTFTVNVGDIDIDVTGKASTTVQWEVSYKIERVSTN